MNEQPLDPEHIKSLHASGYSLRQIAAATGSYRKRIKEVLGDDFKHTIKLDTEALSSMYDLCDQGITVGRIAAHFGVCERTVRRALSVYKASKKRREFREAEAALIKAGWSKQRIREFFNGGV